VPSKAPQSVSPSPFLRWAGGKRRLTDLLLESFPKTFDPKKSNFFEPFVGGGALMIRLGDISSPVYVDGKHLFINDINPDLILTYNAIQKTPTKLMKELDRIAVKKNEVEYYRIREWNPSGNIQRAARFIYLNKTCFNGLWRVNSSGEFNVPFGKLKNPLIYDRSNILSISNRLKGATITNLPFANAVDYAKEGDLVYFDPPYIPLNVSSSFAQYAKEGFGLMDQYALAGVIEGLSNRGVNVILSNSDTKETREIFGPILSLHQISAPRSISAKASSRGDVKEVIGLNFKINNKSELRHLRVVS
jgi:DNA adenine methylase